MPSATTTETPLHLEPCGRDTFIADLEPHRDGPSRPAPESACETPEASR